MPDFSLYKKELMVGAESIDIQGHVNNREYMRWMEEAAQWFAGTSRNPQTPAASAFHVKTVHTRQQASSPLNRRCTRVFMVKIAPF